mgnify:CR=1 FL=1
MYLCICNAITDKQVRQRACAARCSVADVYRACGCRPQCGKCVGAIRDLLVEMQGQPVDSGAFLEGAAAAPSE